MTNSNVHSVFTSFRHGLRGRFLVVLIAGAAVTTICSATFGYFHGKKLRNEGVGVALQKTAEKVSGQIDTSLETAVSMMTQLADSTEVRAALLKKTKKTEPSAPDRSIQATRALAAFAARNPNFEALRVIDHMGKSRVAFESLEMPYPGQKKWWDFAGAAVKGTAAISQPVITGKRASVSVYISVPIRPRGQRAVGGELHAEYSLDSTISEETRNERELLAFLLADARTRRLHILGPPRLASPQAIGFREQGERIVAPKSGHAPMEFGQPEGEVLAGYAPVRHSLASSPFNYQDSKKWFVIVATQKTYAMAPVNSLFSQAIGFGAAVLILVSLVGLAFAQRILMPIRVLQQGVQEIGQGNLEHRIDVRSGDEIESLASEFNRMAERMQRTQEQLQRRGKELGERVNQLRRLQAQLMQSERMAATGELAAQIAHEINNPLGIIKNYVGIAKLLMTEEDPNRENLLIVDQEINRIAGIVRRLLKFAKPGTEDIQSVQINQVLEELLALLRGQLFRRKIDVALELADNLPEVSVSTDQMRQVFLNLIKNAEDAMPDGGTLAVRTRYRKGQVEIEIADTGCGIPTEDVKNIFEPFYTTKGVKGTGLGLSVSYGIVKNYNGEINVDSEPGIGTTFTIQLPVISDKVFQVVKSS